MSKYDYYCKYYDLYHKVPSDSELAKFILGI